MRTTPLHHHIDIGIWDKSLPETRPLPSAEGFAEDQISGFRQKRGLLSAALGKDRHSANNLFAECRTIGK
jgi:hypothetical protein